MVGFEIFESHFIVKFTNLAEFVVFIGFQFEYAKKRMSIRQNTFDRLN